MAGEGGRWLGMSGVYRLSLTSRLAWVLALPQAHSPCWAEMWSSWWMVACPRCSWSRWGRGAAARLWLISSHGFPCNELVSEVSPQMSAVCCYVLGKQWGPEETEWTAISKLWHHLLEMVNKLCNSDEEILLNCSVCFLLEAKLFNISIHILSDLIKQRKTVILTFVV